MNSKLESFFVDITKGDFRNAYFKAAIYGEQGSGKTHSAVSIAIGIAKQTGADSIAVFDTEAAAAFHKNRVKKAGLKFLYKNSKSLKAAIEFIRLCEEAKVPGVIDSATHLWRELQEGYKVAKGIDRILLPDWMVLKPVWAEFADAYVHSKAHMIACGRAGIVTEDTNDEDSGRNSGFKVTGTKMKSEGEFGYEASLELEMEKRGLNPKLRKSLKASLPKKKHQFLERADASVCVVKKDRNPDSDTTMMGREIYFPIFEDFTDHMKCLNFGGSFVDRSGGSSAEFFQTEQGAVDKYAWKRRRETILAMLWDETLVLADMVGTSKETKQARTRLLCEVFGTAAIPAIEDMPTQKLLEGIDEIQRRFKLPPYDKEAHHDTAVAEAFAPVGAGGEPTEVAS